MSLQGYQWKCKRCGREIKSFYKNQFEYNKRLHEESCKKDKMEV